MTPPVVAFFNNKGGVGKTSLVYHVAWMMARKGHRVLAADLDPQANLTAHFLDEETVAELWWPPRDRTQRRWTVYGSLQPLVRAVGDIEDPQLYEITESVDLMPGDMALSGFEDELSNAWPGCLDGRERSFRVISAFWRLMTRAAKEEDRDIILADVGPNLGALNRAAMVAADYVVIPLGPDLFSVQGLQNLGPTLRRWRTEWTERVARNPDPDLPLPEGGMRPVGYVLLGHGVRLGRPVKAYERWMTRIPDVYRSAVLGVDEQAPRVDDDPHCLAQLKHYYSLMPLAYEARKPIFELKPADGAFGGHQAAVTSARKDFSALTDRILRDVGVTTRTQ